MGQVSRHAGAPFVNGETAFGSEVEEDIAAIVAQVNGNLDSTNIAAGANIPGSALAAASIPGSKIQAATITNPLLADDAVGTDELANEAATQSVVAEGVATVALSGSYGTIASALITTHATTRHVIVMCRFHLTNGVGALNTVTVQLLRGASHINNGGGAFAEEIVTLGAAAGWGQILNLFWVDTNPVAGAASTYHIQAKSSAACNAKNRQLVCLELRR